MPSMPPQQGRVAAGNGKNASEKDAAWGMPISKGSSAIATIA